MIANKIYHHLNEFVNAFGPILNIFPTNLRSFRTFTSFLPIKFEANIVIIDLNQKYYFRVSPEDYYLRKNNYDFCDLTLISDAKTWIKVFSGKETLMGAYDLGNIEMTNVREHFLLRLAFLSNLIFSFATKKQKLIRIGKDLKFPLFNKRIIAPIFKLTITIFKLIPKYVITQLITKISPLLEEAQ